MLDFKFWRRWLLAVSVIIIVGGSLFALLSWSPAFNIINGLVNDTFWPGSAPDPGARGFQQWAYGMLGGTMAGWGVFLAYIIRYPFAQKEAWSWECIAAGVALWFAIDTAVSVYVTAYFNVAINLILLILVAIPLLMTRNESWIKDEGKRIQA